LFHSLHYINLPFQSVKLGVYQAQAQSQALGQAIYEATQAEQAAGDAGAPQGGGADDVVDAEVVEDDDREAK